jgi:uracil-DNA glycosylase family protein
MAASTPQKRGVDAAESPLEPGAARDHLAIDTSHRWPMRPSASIQTPHRTSDEAGNSLSSLRETAAHCRDCPLWKDATQTVFGAGRSAARIVLVGEQPGNQEDLTGKPFVGPAGLLLDRALDEAGVDRKATYVTNAVKHFKFELRGKRRLHKKPNELEIAACHQWLEREVEVIDPALIVALGATAARAVFGRTTGIDKNRGRILNLKDAGARGLTHEADVLVTIHPSFLLRMPPEDKDAAFERFVADLKLARPYF